MIRKLLILLFITPLIGCAQQETKRAYYPSGKLLSIIQYTDGIRNGTTQYFHDYGAWAIKSSVHYKNGKMIGLFKSYNKYGHLIEEGNYKYTEDGVYSRKDGVWKTYYESSEVKGEITYENGKIIKYISYEKDGSITPIPEGGC